MVADQVADGPDAGKHIAYWNGGRWVPWCDVETAKPIKTAVTEICPACLSLAVEELASGTPEQG